MFQRTLADSRLDLEVGTKVMDKLNIIRIALEIFC